MSPNTAVGAKAGLFTDSGAAVPLAGVRVDAEISNLCARVEITQRFVNRECTPIEAVYVFPLDESAALCGFSAMIGSTLVVGEVMERSKAFETYDKALEVGHGAFLLDQERPDVFTASVGNVLPGMEVTPAPGLRHRAKAGGQCTALRAADHRIASIRAAGGPRRRSGH
jgi:Ca-activated chloride channel family protein